MAHVPIPSSGPFIPTVVFVDFFFFDTFFGVFDCTMDTIGFEKGLFKTKKNNFLNLYTFLMIHKML